MVLPPGDMNTYVLYITTPNGFVHPSVDARRVDRLEGGLYACLPTVSYGLMTGVLERIYQQNSEVIKMEKSMEQQERLEHVHRQNLYSSRS
jgi:hypothetical protein